MVAPVDWQQRHVVFEPTGYGQFRQREVSKHRAEDRMHPLTVTKLLERCG
jgi:hypothetical protein